MYMAIIGSMVFRILWRERISQYIWDKKEVTHAWLSHTSQRVFASVFTIAATAASQGISGCSARYSRTLNSRSAGTGMEPRRAFSAATTA